MVGTRWGEGQSFWQLSPHQTPGSETESHTPGSLPAIEACVTLPNSAHPASLYNWPCFRPWPIHVLVQKRNPAWEEAGEVRGDRWVTRGRQNLLLGVPLALSCQGGGRHSGRRCGQWTPLAELGEACHLLGTGRSLLGKVPPPGKWRSKGCRLQGKWQGCDAHRPDSGAAGNGPSPAESARWTSAPFIHAQAAEGHTCPGSRRLRTSAWWTQQRPLSACPTALRGTQCALSPQVGLVERETSPGCPASFWPYPSLPAVWKLKELSLSTTVRETSET